MSRQQITSLLKWTILVLINTIVSFLFALEQFKTFLDLAGTLTAIAFFIVLYYHLEQWFIRHNYPHLVKRLIIATLLKSVTQFYPIIEMLTGVIAMDFVDKYITSAIFFRTFSITLLDGILLSLIVAFLFAVIQLFFFIYQKIKASS